MNFPEFWRTGGPDDEKIAKAKRCIERMAEYAKHPATQYEGVRSFFDEPECLKYLLDEYLKLRGEPVGESGYYVQWAMLYRNGKMIERRPMQALRGKAPDQLIIQHQQPYSTMPPLNDTEAWSKLGNEIACFQEVFTKSGDCPACRTATYISQNWMQGPKWFEERFDPWGKYSRTLR